MVQKIQMTDPVMQNDAVMPNDAEMQNDPVIQRTLVGEDLSSDDEHFIMTVTGVDDKSDLYRKIKVKRET